MNILITGTGAVGIALAATLANAGETISLCARGTTLSAIQADGLHRGGLFDPVDIPAKAVTAQEGYDYPDGTFDYILIASKAMANADISAALAQHRGILKPEGKIVLFQNGWGNDRLYLEQFDRSQIYSARIITGFERPRPNESTITVYTQPIVLGSLYGLDLAPMEPLARAITRGGIPCEVTEDVAKALWAKMVYNCALNPLGAVLGLHYGALAENPHSKAIVDDVIREVFAVMHAAGYSTYWPDAEAYRKEFYAKLLPDTYHHHASTLQDIQAKRPTEIDTLTGQILTLAEAHQVDVPANRMLYRLVKAKEANY